MLSRPPTHPGAILRDDVFPFLEISLDDFANYLGISCQSLQDVLSEKSPLTSGLAIKLGALLGNGPQLWIEMQSKHDLWQKQAKLKAQ